MSASALLSPDFFARDALHVAQASASTRQPPLQRVVSWPTSRDRLREPGTHRRTLALR